jgi:hypothetical protein
MNFATEHPPALPGVRDTNGRRNSSNNRTQNEHANGISVLRCSGKPGSGRL